jgi:mono/diheme cytochrome c family protein
MSRSVKYGIAGGVLAIVVGTAALVLIVRRGFSARDEPSAIEAFIARRVRRLAIPCDVRDAKNPVPATPETLAEARAHFADHCAICHANDGSGDTAIGRNLYPPAPDMREEPTQSLTDGEIFYIIHNGVRFTGMPAWGPEDPAEDRDSWALVHFIRHLPRVTEEELAEMEGLNPKSRKEIEEEEAVRRFLGGEDAESPSEGHHH